jgi:hypothetical protein
LASAPFDLPGEKSPLPSGTGNRSVEWVESDEAKQIINDWVSRNTKTNLVVTILSEPELKAYQPSRYLLGFSMGGFNALRIVIVSQFVAAYGCHEIDL